MSKEKIRDRKRGRRWNKRKCEKEKVKRLQQGYGISEKMRKVRERSRKQRRRGNIR